MYMVSWVEEDGRVDASLDGRVTVEEMRMFAEELREVVATFVNRPYVLTIDHSRAKPFESEAARLLSTLKDECLDGPVRRIVTVVEDEDAKARLMNERVMPIYLGREKVMLAAVHAERPQSYGNETSGRPQEAA